MNNLELPKGLSFGDLLNWLLAHGVRPPGAYEQGQRWNREIFAERVQRSEKQVRNWLANRSLPNIDDPVVPRIERAFFGSEQNYRFDWRIELRESLRRTREKSTAIPSPAPVEPRTAINEEATDANAKPYRARTKFVFTPPSIGANWKPDPSHVDEKEGYCFSGHFEVDVAVDCHIARLELVIERDGDYAICSGPGNASYFNGPLPGEKRKFGYVLVDGEEVYVDSSYRFLRPVGVSAGQKLIVSISRWCRAIGMSKNDPRTLSIEYWIRRPTQVVLIEYLYAGKRYSEEHVFEFNDKHRMELRDVRFRPID
jgi:hypothetical protein